jgi:hypothetical protein
MKMEKLSSSSRKLVIVNTVTGKAIPVSPSEFFIAGKTKT